MLRLQSSSMGDALDKAGESLYTGQLIRAPLVPLAVALSAGCVAGRYLPAPVGLWMLLGVAGLLAAAVTLSQARLRAITTAGILAAVVSLGAVRMQLAWYSLPRDDIATYSRPSQILATIRGTVASFPQLFSTKVQFGYQPAPRVEFLLDADEILTRTHPSDGPSVWCKTSGLVRVSIEEPSLCQQPGQRIELQGWLGRYNAPANPGQHDTALVARRNGTSVWFRSPSQRCIQTLSPDSGGLSSLLWRWRAVVRQHLLETGDLQDGLLVNALILGERSASLETLNRTMQQAGVAHFLSISGTHLGVFLGFVYLLCRMLFLKPKPAAVVALVVLGAYLLLAAPNPPLLRSAIMAAAILGAVITGRRGSVLNALGLAAILLLLIDPRQILQPGFQLSFIIVAGLLFLFYPIRRLIFGRWLRRRGLVVFRSDQRFRRWIHYSLVNRLIDLVTLSITCYVVAGPVVMVKFGLFSPWAIVLNVVLFPLVAAVLVPGYLSMMLAWPAPNLAQTVGSLAGAAADLLTNVVDSFRVLPYMHVLTRPVGVGWCVLCYATLLAAIFAQGVRWRRILATVLAGVFVAATVWTQLPARTDDAQFDLLAVGAGQCAVLQTPDGKTYLFDAGTRSGFDACERVLKPFLREMRLPCPPTAFVSHANADHYSILPNLAREGELETLYVGDYFRNDKQPFDPANHLLELLHADGVTVHTLRRGDHLQLDDRTSVDVLWPPEGRTGLTVNGTSLVLRITCDDRRILLPGDLDEVGQAELLQQPEQLRADVLVLPHHGGWCKTLPAFVAAVQPSVIFVSGNRDPKGPEAGSEAVRAFYPSLRSKYRYFSTPHNGWVRLHLGKGGQSVQTMR